ncbi:hypothetical protein EI534_14180 [Pseudomonas frederiksbergensis]|nr:hypothetical protein [Pseudomonas frederiksbergensis]
MEFEGFMYLDVEHPAVAWNVYRGVLLSQSLIKKSTPSSSPISMTLARVLIDREWGRLGFEMTLEKRRRESFPSQTSRLTGLFVFDTPESALAVANNEAWGGDDGHIRDENLTDVGVSAKSNNTRLDANWISWMLQVRQEGSNRWLDGVDAYWRGAPCPHFGNPIWEVLIDGAVTIWGTALRERAYKLAKDRTPMAACLMEISRLAATIGSDLGHIGALVKAENDHHLVSFHIDMQDAENPAFLEKVKTHIEANPDRVNGHDLSIGEQMFRLPDFIAYTYVVGS